MREDQHKELASLEKMAVGMAGWRRKNLSRLAGYSMAF
jgi:hypothetical protein